MQRQKVLISDYGFHLMQTYGCSKCGGKEFDRLNICDYCRVQCAWCKKAVFFPQSELISASMVHEIEGKGVDRSRYEWSFKIDEIAEEVGNANGGTDDTLLRDFETAGGSDQSQGSEFDF